MAPWVFELMKFLFPSDFCLVNFESYGNITLENLWDLWSFPEEFRFRWIKKTARKTHRKGNSHTQRTARSSHLNPAQKYIGMGQILRNELEEGPWGRHRAKTTSCSACLPPPGSLGHGLQSLRGECGYTGLEGFGSRSKHLHPDVLIHVPAGDLSAQSAMTSEFTGSPNHGISWVGRGPEGILSSALGPAQENSKNHHIPDNIVQDLHGAVQDPFKKGLSSGSFHPFKFHSSNLWHQQSIQMVLVWNV